MEDKALVPRQEQQLDVGPISAKEVIEAASEIATRLADIIERQKLYVNIEGNKYVKLEGWTALARLQQCIPREVSCDADKEGNYLAIVELVRITDGQIISRASAECCVDEKRWGSAPRFARRSMAITRATGKAARLAFSWCMSMAGYEPTPAEEMDFLEHKTVPTGLSSTKQEKTEEEPMFRNLSTLEIAGEIDQINTRAITKKDGTATTLFTIKLKDGSEYTTFSRTIAEEAKALKDKAEAVKISYDEVRRGKYTNYQIKNIEPL